MQKIRSFLNNNWIILTILLVATVVRFYSLSTLPPGLYPDEAANGLDIIRMIEEGDHQVVYNTNGPRESLFFYFQAIAVYAGKLFNITSLHFTPLSLRIAPAAIGVIGVWALYLLAKEMFDKNVGLLAAATMAVSAWHIQFSRNGFRAIMLPMVLSFMFYFFIRAYREGKLKDYLWFAFFLAMGMYTYLSIRMVPLIFMAFLSWTFMFDRGFLKKNVKNLGYAIGLFFLLLIPMLIHFVYVPADILGRASTSIFNPELNNGSAIKTLGGNILKEIKMMNFAGDINFRHNLGGSPMLDIVTGIFFWVGFGHSLIKIKKIEHFLLLAWLGAMSLPMILTAEGIPHALRLVGAMPVIFIWIALGINLAGKLIKNEKLKYVFFATVILFASFLGIKKYFVDFPSHAEAREAYTEDMVRLGQDLKKSNPDTTNYLITGEFGLKTVYYITHAQQPKTIQLETYEIVEQFRPVGPYYNIYITSSWYDQAVAEFSNLGYNLVFMPVTSTVDGKVLYYVYQN